VAVLSDLEWNTQNASFAFQVPIGWRDLTEQELLELAHWEGTRVWAGITTTSEPRCLVHVTTCLGRLSSYTEDLKAEAWQRAEEVSLVWGPYLLLVGNYTGVVLQYSCLDYDGRSANMKAEPREDGLPDYMTLLLVVVHVHDFLYRISLYGAEEEVEKRQREFQSVLDSWLWLVDEPETAA
jgi:hypothetical protein